MRKKPLELSSTDRHYLEALLRKGTMGVKLPPAEPEAYYD